MAEGDYGIALPVIVEGATFTASDSLKVTIKNNRNGTAILEKTYSNITNNTIQFELTEAESALLPVGQYAYSLDWFEEGNFLCNIIPIGFLKVVDKA